jgi:flagellar hook-associated protein 2
MSMLADIGISTGAVNSGAVNSSGKLVVDETKLDAALASNPSGVKDILGKIGSGPATEDGIVRRISNLVSQLRVGGTVDNAMSGASTQIKSLQTSIDKFAERLERKRSYYDRMFSRMETNVGNIQNQTSWLSSQFQSMMSNNG